MNPCPSADAREDWANLQMGIAMGDALRLDRHNHLAALLKRRDAALREVREITEERPRLLARALLLKDATAADEDATAQHRKARLERFIADVDLALPVMQAWQLDIGVPAALGRRNARLGVTRGCA